MAGRGWGGAAGGLPRWFALAGRVVPDAGLSSARVLLGLSHGRVAGLLECGMQAIMLPWDLASKVPGPRCCCIFPKQVSHLGQLRFKGREVRPRL